MEMHEFKEGANSNLPEQSPYTKTHFECASLELNEQNQFLAEYNMCLLHQKPLEIVCVYDLQKVCSKCAIFGEHKGHDFKSLEQIEEEKFQFCEQLGTIFSLKNQIMNRIENKTTKSDIISILNEKRMALSKQIKQKFKSLIDTIKAEESKVLYKLQGMNKQFQKQIDNLYKIDNSLIWQYENWQKQAHSKLNSIKKGTFEQQLKLLIKVGSIKGKNSLSQGYSLVDLMRTQEQNIITNSQALLGSLNLKVCDKIFELIPTFVDVLDKPQEVAKYLEFYPSIQYSPQSSNQINLLEIEGSNEEIILPQKVTFYQSPIQSVEDIEIKPQSVKLIPFLERKVFDEKTPKKHIERKTLTKRQFPRQKMKTQCTEQLFLHTIRQTSFASEKSIRLAKKKVKNIKVPEKYEKILESLSADTLQILDLTNAELGDEVILKICELLTGSKVKSVKLIRNKLTDEGLTKMLPFMGDLVTINLSQNFLTEKILDILIKNRPLLPKVKNIVLSMNKIVERKDKKKIDELRKFQMTVSV